MTARRYPRTRYSVYQTRHLDILFVLQTIFGAGDSPIPPFLSFDSHQIITCSMCSSSFNCNSANFSKDDIQVLSIIAQRVEKHFVGGNLFHCYGGVYISSYYICDGKIDCIVGYSDEEGCTCKKASSSSSRCKYLVMGAGKMSCSFFNITSKKNECLMHNSSVQYNLKTNEKKRLILNNKVVDPGLITAKHERIRSPKQQCKKHGLLSCRYRHTRCYSISEICSYKISKQGILFPCPAGDHIQSCRDFQCNLMFKCPGYYCIPWSYVCDSQWDCPDGLDEEPHHNCGKNRPCTNLFKCKNSQICIHLAAACDGHNDCPSGDDEYFCSLSVYKCPFPCECLMFFIQCHKANLSLGPNLIYHAIWIDKSFFVEGLFQSTFRNAIVITIRASNLLNVCYFGSQMHNCVSLDFSFNFIAKLESGCFKMSYQVKIINLSSNRISTIKIKVFSANTSLLILNLTNNELCVLQKDMFESLSHILILSVKTNILNTVDKDTFLGKHISFLQTEKLSLCCSVSSETICTETFPWYFSCSKLLPRKSHQTAFYSMSAIVFSINVLSIILHRLTYLKGLEKTGAYGTIVVSINFSDITFVLSFALLWAADLYYNETFVFFEQQWRSSFVCFGVFGIFLNQSFLSSTLVCFWSYSRLAVVLHPVDTKFKQTKFVLKTIFFGIVTILTCVLGFTVLTRILVSKVPTPICSPFIDPTDTVVIIKVFIWMNAVFTLFGAAFLNTVHCCLISSLLESQKVIKDSSSYKHQSNKAIIGQIVIVTLSNSLCWVSSSVIFLLVMFWNQYPHDMSIWTTVVVVPHNSVFNPIVFVATSVRKLLRKK